MELKLLSVGLKFTPYVGCLCHCVVKQRVITMTSFPLGLAGTCIFWQYKKNEIWKRVNRSTLAVLIICGGLEKPVLLTPDVEFTLFLPCHCCFQVLSCQMRTWMVYCCLPEWYCFSLGSLLVVEESSVILFSAIGWVLYCRAPETENIIFLWCWTPWVLTVPCLSE